MAAAALAHHLPVAHHLPWLQLRAAVDVLTLFNEHRPQVSEDPSPESPRELPTGKKNKNRGVLRWLSAYFVKANQELQNDIDSSRYVHLQKMIYTLW